MKQEWCHVVELISVLQKYCGAAGVLIVFTGDSALVGGFFKSVCVQM